MLELRSYNDNMHIQKGLLVIAVRYFTKLNANISVFVCAYLQILVSLPVANAINNGIVGLPEIQCDSSRILISIRTQRPFAGRVFLKGNSHRAECVSDFTEHPTLNDTRLKVSIDYNLCNTERIRQVSALPFVDIQRG